MIEKSTAQPPRPIAVTVFSILCAAMFTGGVLVVLGSAGWLAIGRELPTDPSGGTALDAFADHWILATTSLVLTAAFSIGLWRGISGVRHLILGAWSAAFVYACALSLSHQVSLTALLDDLLRFLVSLVVLWWYFFRKRTSVRFFVRRDPITHAV
jgi:hypothetical protein